MGSFDQIWKTNWETGSGKMSSIFCLMALMMLSAVVMGEALGMDRSFIMSVSMGPGKMAWTWIFFGFSSARRDWVAEKRAALEAL